MSLFKHFKKENSEKDVAVNEYRDAEFVVVSDDDQQGYFGEVVSVHDGFSYIGRVRRGYQTIATNGDVFVPQVLKVGELVEFDELNSDPKRPGKFRTESVRIPEGGLVSMDPDSNNVVAIRDLVCPSVYHAGRKQVPAEDVEQAIANQPFEELIRNRQEMSEGGAPEDDVAKMAEGFLITTFAALFPIGVSYSVDGDVDKEAEQAKVDEAIVLYEEQGMTGQIESVRKEYEQFSGVRDAFTLMRSNGILSLETVIPMYYLPEMLCIAPVWFVYGRKNIPDNTVERDPRPDHAVQYFCDQVGSREFSWFYQIYNRRTRPLRQFQGRDIMPPALMKILGIAKATFDYVVIMTPYHDIASREWADPNWLRNIDPYLVGFMDGLPYMFLLGRWSGTGLFPLVADMIGDTMNHLRCNKKLLGNFKSNTWWYKGLKDDDEDGILQDIQGGDGNNAVLEPFADQVLQAFEEGQLFEFLRGETGVNLPVTR